MWLWTCLLISCVAVSASESSSDKDSKEWLEVTIHQGTVRGRRDASGDLFVFNNIPYATAPTGENKFKAPLPPPAWLQPLESSEKEIICPQDTTGIPILQGKTMHEDCLIANVFVPISKETDLPVLVYIHGGAYEVGYGNLFSPKNFVREKNLIVVTFNYRLGVHGFLCLGTEAVGGNAGLKDQVALLRWVKKNIARFGGNPNDVTVAGYSAGSVSADFLMLSDSTEGLFKKVILESGANVGSIATQINPIENAKIFAKKNNFTEVDDIYALEEFYKTTSLEVLVRNTFFERKDASLLFGPCVERKSKSAFISDSPVNIIKKGKYRKVPILIGITNMEGLLQIPTFEAWKDEMNENFSKFVPANLYFKNEDEKKEIAGAIKEFYFGNQLVSENTILSYIDYFTDVFFAYPTLMAVKAHVENGHKEIYLYEYSFVDNATPVVPYTNVRGANHCTQTMAVLDEPGNTNITEEFRKMKSTMRELWYNFVVDGKPVPEGSSLLAWPPVGADRSPHMSIGQTMELGGSLLESRARFWDNIYQKYYRDPVAPPKPPSTEL